LGGFRSDAPDCGANAEARGTLTASDPGRLAAFNAEYEALVSEYLTDNVVRKDYLLTRATKI
jgi:hypothetical protein